MLSFALKLEFGFELVYAYMYSFVNSFQGLGAMRGKINLDYDISPSPFNRHRALYLYAPTTDMSGNYTCKVSTLQNEVTMTKAMIVYGERWEKSKRRPFVIGGRRGVLWEIEFSLV